MSVSCEVCGLHVRYGSGPHICLGSNPDLPMIPGFECHASCGRIARHGLYCCSGCVPRGQGGLATAHMGHCDEFTEAVRGLPQKPVATAHDYTSTACQHELHEECRKTCKFCPAPCRCTCHPTETT